MRTLEHEGCNLQYSTPYRILICLIQVTFMLATLFQRTPGHVATTTHATHAYSTLLTQQLLTPTLLHIFVILFDASDHIHTLCDYEDLRHLNVLLRAESRLVCSFLSCSYRLRLAGISYVNNNKAYQYLHRYRHNPNSQSKRMSRHL
jgi:hypothetical protein